MKFRFSITVRPAFRLAVSLALALAAPPARAAALSWDGAGTWTGAGNRSTVPGGPYTATWVKGDEAVSNVLSSTLTLLRAITGLTIAKNLNFRGSAAGRVRLLNTTR